MKLFLAFAALAVACSLSSCSSTDENVDPPAESTVWRIAPGTP